MAESAALVMGGTTYRWMIDHDPEMLTGPEKWREYYDERPVWVFTHATDLPEVRGTQVRFVQTDARHRRPADRRSGADPIPDHEALKAPAVARPRGHAPCERVTHPGDPGSTLAGPVRTPDTGP
ncbi:hypothetical protein [Nocardioides panzhihuensis]|uniref:Uncharacterized protein n=1 Tax=Nocardioides panzhihuensis TaxID=860243 RepID=A0A7Z0DQW6_9ACTN|nr:hypothetical protein [Nocardioides panzhihuensis]NYI79681.1 hypothetical protein [Nocardioides panzhihuensis]